MKIKWRASKAYGNYSIIKRLLPNMALSHVNESGKSIYYSSKISAKMAAYYKNIEDNQ